MYYYDSIDPTSELGLQLGKYKNVKGFSVPVGINLRGVRHQTPEALARHLQRECDYPDSDRWSIQMVVKVEVDHDYEDHELPTDEFAGTAYWTGQYVYNYLPTKR